LVPAQGADGPEKAVVALTPLSVLNTKRAQLEAAFLDITRVSIAEMALKNLLRLMASKQAIEEDAPTIMMSLCDTVYTLHIIYQNTFYLIRGLEINVHDNPKNPDNASRLIFELERSIEYCVSQLNLPEPKQLFFTPSFHQLTHCFQAIEDKLIMKVEMIDLTRYLDMNPPLGLEEQAQVFVSITGALHFNHDEASA